MSLKFEPCLTLHVQLSRFQICPAGGGASLCALQGFCPPVQAALDLYRMLSEPGIDLRQPVRLENQLLTDNAEMDSEVGQSMLQLLQVLPTAISPCLPACIPATKAYPSLPFPFLLFPPPFYLPAFSPLPFPALWKHL